MFCVLPFRATHVTAAYENALLIVPQYGAEMMESSVKTISRPVIDRLPVGQLDDFACRQLDRVRHILVLFASDYCAFSYTVA